MCGFGRVLSGFWEGVAFCFCPVADAALDQSSGPEFCRGLGGFGRVSHFAFAFVDIDSLAALVGTAATKQFQFILGL